MYFDTNIIVDFLAERQPFCLEVAKVVTLSEKGLFKIYASPLSIATTHYLVAKNESPNVALAKLRKFKVLSNVCVMNEQVVEKSLNANFKDFEDGLQYYTAIENNCDIIITRNLKDFKFAKIPVMTAKEFLKSIL